MFLKSKIRALLIFRGGWGGVGVYGGKGGRGEGALASISRECHLANAEVASSSKYELVQRLIASELIQS